MTTYDVKRLALVLAIQAEIEGMKIYNLKNPDNLGYGEEDFNSMADKLRNIAASHDEQL